MTGVDPEEVTVREAVQAALPENRTDGQHDPSRMDETCFNCDSALSPVTGIGGGGLSLRVGVCPHCRTDGAGGTAFLELRDDPISPSTRKHFERLQANGHAQSPHSAAAFLLDAPAGEYEVRRVRPTVLEVRVPDAVDPGDIGVHYLDADNWSVDVLHEKNAVQLTDIQMG